MQSSQNGPLSSAEEPVTITPALLSYNLKYLWTNSALDKRMVSNMYGPSELAPAPGYLDLYWLLHLFSDGAGMGSVSANDTCQC